MIGWLPRYEQGALEYQYALDAAASMVAGCDKLMLKCGVSELKGDLRQRLISVGDREEVDGCIWLEPSAENWQAELADITGQLPVGGMLVVVISTPLGRWLPECQNWRGKALGHQFAGLRKLNLHLKSQDFQVTDQYGLHPLRVIVLNAINQFLEGNKWAAWGDRIAANARGKYLTSSMPWSLFTVKILLADRLGRFVR